MNIPAEAVREAHIKALTFLLRSSGSDTLTREEAAALQYAIDRLAALAGAAPVASTETVTVEAGFVYENGIHTPTVLVSFNPNDWAARDQFVAEVKAPHAPAKAREDGPIAYTPAPGFHFEHGDGVLRHVADGGDK